MGPKEIATRLFIMWPAATLMVFGIELIAGSLGLAVADSNLHLSEEGKELVIKNMVVAMVWSSPLIGGAFAAYSNRLSA